MMYNLFPSFSTALFPPITGSPLKSAHTNLRSEPPFGMHSGHDSLTVTAHKPVSLKHPVALSRQLTFGASSTEAGRFAGTPEARSRIPEIIDALKTLEEKTGQDEVNVKLLAPDPTGEVFSYLVERFGDELFLFALGENEETVAWYQFDSTGKISDTGHNYNDSNAKAQIDFLLTDFVQALTDRQNQRITPPISIKIQGTTRLEGFLESLNHASRASTRPLQEKEPQVKTTIDILQKLVDQVNALPGQDLSGQNARIFIPLSDLTAYQDAAKVLNDGRGVHHASIRIENFLTNRIVEKLAALPKPNSAKDLSSKGIWLQTEALTQRCQPLKQSDGTSYPPPPNFLETIEKFIESLKNR